MFPANHLHDDALPDEVLPDEALNPSHLLSSQDAAQPDQQPLVAPIDHINDLDQNREEENRAEGNSRVEGNGAETQTMG